MFFYDAASPSAESELPREKTVSSPSAPMEDGFHGLRCVPPFPGKVVRLNDPERLFGIPAAALY
jgi:hypothetical protein